LKKDARPSLAKAMRKALKGLEVMAVEVLWSGSKG